MGGSLYQRLLGEEFDRLPLPLQNFHSGPGVAEGAFSVWRRSGVGEECHGRVEVTSENGRERWRRQIGSWTFATLQWERRGLLIERYGAIQLGFQVVANEHGLSFVQRQCWVLGVPLPKPLWFRVAANVTATEDGWEVAVRIGAPLLGELCRYEGRLTPV